MLNAGRQKENENGSNLFYHCVYLATSTLSAICLFLLAMYIYTRKDIDIMAGARNVGYLDECIDDGRDEASGVS